MTPITATVETGVWFEKAVAEGKDLKEAFSEHSHDQPLPREASQMLVSLFKRLADPTLICRCM